MHSEFTFIQNIKKRFSLNKVGDDCAIIPKDEVNDLLITADLLVEDIDFRLSWADPLSIGHKALAVSLSDIAAMGGKPRWSTLSIGVPEKLWDSAFIDDLYAGWHALAAIYGVELVGGDISRSPDKFVIDSVVLGEVPGGKAIRRSGGRSGDGIFVSGPLGGSAAGLKILEAGDPNRPYYPHELRLIDRQLRPIPQITLSRELATLEIVSSMIDLSDGLSSDLRHICEASDLGAVVDLNSIPRETGLHEVFSSETKIQDAILHGGEDFELLFTVGPGNFILLDGMNVTQIGILTDNAGEILVTEDGSDQPLVPKGYQHFQ